MADLWAIREGMGLRPWGAESAAVLGKIPFGKPLQVEVRQPRNSKHSALYWVLCHRIADAVGCTSENVSDLLKIGTGHCTVMRSKVHGELKLPASISFAKMDQQAFSAFFERCLVTITTEWGIARPDILSAVSDLLDEKETA